MKKVLMILVSLLMLFAACSSFAENEGEPLPEEELLTWSEPGAKYIANLLAPIREIHNEAEAKAYAEELCPLMNIGTLPEGTWDIGIDHHDESYHCSILNENSVELYGASFLSNGVIQLISYPDPDTRWFTEGIRKEGSELEAGRKEQAENQIIAWVEKNMPGVLELVEPLSVYSMIDVGDKQYLFVTALPLDPELDGSVNIIAILYEDGHCGITDYSCYGAG
jgi:hypothetical protein